MAEELIHLAAKLYRVSHLATSCISEIPPTTSQFLLLALFLSSSTTSQNRKFARSITTTIDHIASTITITTDDKITPSPSPPLPRFSTALFFSLPAAIFDCALLLPPPPPAISDFALLCPPSPAIFDFALLSPPPPANMANAYVVLACVAVLVAIATQITSRWLCLFTISGFLYLFVSRTR